MKKWLCGLGGGALIALLFSHLFLAEEQLSIIDTKEEKSAVISELVNSELDAGINSLAMDGVDNIEDVTVDSSDVIFDWCKVGGILDGSGALDSTTGNGYDSSLTNKVVRTHDTITYQINLGLQLNGELNETVYRSGELNVRFTLPVSSDKAVFDSKALSFFKDVNIVESNGQQVLTGKFILPTNSQGFAIPCAARCDIVVAIKDIENNFRFTPRFEFSSKSSIWEHVIVPDPVTITCRTYYKIGAGSATVNKIATRQDYTGTNRSNTWLGLFDVSIKPKSSKDADGNEVKEKGVFFPKKVQFTIDTSCCRDDNKQIVSSWICDWSFTGSTGKNGNNLSSPALPVWDSSKNISNGTISVSGKRMTVTLEGYGESGGTFRIGMLGVCPDTGIFYGLKLECKNLQAMNGSSWENVIDGENFTKYTLMRNYPVGGYTMYYSVASRCNTSDRHSMFLLNDGDGGAGNKANLLNSDLREGQDAVLSRNQELTLSSAAVLNQGYSDFNHFMSLNVYLLFDSNCFEVDESKEKTHFAYVKNANWSSSSSKMLYIAKSNGSAFSSKSEMDSFGPSTANNYRYYTSLSALKSSGAQCVGVCTELRNVWSGNEAYRTDSWFQIDVPVKVKNGCTINKAYSVTGGFNMSIGTTWGSHTSGSVSGLSSGDFQWFHGKDNTPTRFNTDGSVISQGTSVRYGTTVYVKSAKATIGIEVANKIGNTTKDTFNYSEGEQNVWFKITPGYFGIVNNETWTYSIDIPKELICNVGFSHDGSGINQYYLYYGGIFTESASHDYGGMVTGGEALNNSRVPNPDGSFTLTFTKTFTDENSFEPIWLRCKLDGSKIQNGGNCTVSCNVTGDGAIKVSKLHQNKDATGIITLLNTSVALVKTGIARIGVGDNLLYTITIQNTGTEIKNYEFKDLLPNNCTGTTSDTKYLLNEFIQRDNGGACDIFFKTPGMTSNNISDWNHNMLDVVGNEIEAVGIIGTLNAGEKMEYDLVLGVPDAIMGDVFYNRFQFKAPSLGNENVYSNYVRTEIPITEARLTINKVLQRNTFVTPKGKSIFNYKISTIDDKDKPLTFYKSITIPEGSYRGSITFKVPGRVYKVEELPSNDWSIKSKSAGQNSYLLNNVIDWKEVGTTPSVAWTGTQELYAVLNRGDSATVTFTNEGSFRDYTENDRKLNNLK